MKQYLNIKAVYVILASAGFVSGCFTAKKEKEIKNEISDVRTRIGELEKSVQERGSTVEANSRKSMASAQTELERINVEVQRMRGEMDALKVGVATGEMPGADPNSESIAKKLNDFSARLQALEEKSAAAAAAPVTSGSSAPKATSGEAPATAADKVSVKEIRDAYNTKKFAFVTQNADAVLSRIKTKSLKEEIAFYEAESFFRLNRLREAALKYNDFTEKYAKSPRIAHTKLRLGECFVQLGDPKAARSFFQEVVTRFPKTNEATKAKEQLEGLDAKGAMNDKKSQRVQHARKDGAAPNAPHGKKI